MKSFPLLSALVAVAVATTAPVAIAQSQTSMTADEPKVVHPGGRHDEHAHKAALRAKKEGRRMVEPKVHPGGRHDESTHKASLREQRAADPAAKP